MNRKRFFRVVFGMVFILFIICYVISESGYYEYNLRNKTIMTKESIDRFEKDLKKGKDVRMEDYLVNTNKDYSSRLTVATNRVSNGVNVFLKKGIENVFKFISKVALE